MQRCAYPATAETLALYVADLLARGKKLTTVNRYAAGAAYYHTARGVESPLTPAVRAILSGARQIRCEQPRQMQPITLPQLRAIVTELERNNTEVTTRNIAILTFGFASALRRSNLASLILEDLEMCGAGLRVRIRREKQDRSREGRYIGIPYGKNAGTCPIRRLDAWLAVRGRDPGPLFVRLDHGRRGPLEALTPNAFLDIVKGAAQLVDAGGRYGSHSLRAGFITEAGEAGVGHLLIAAQSGHKSLGSLTRYFRPGDVFRSNAAGMIGL